MCVAFLTSRGMMPPPSVSPFEGPLMKLPAKSKFLSNEHRWQRQWLRVTPAVGQPDFYIILRSRYFLPSRNRTHRWPTVSRKCALAPR